MAAAKKDHNEVAELENWRIRIRKEEASSAKWEDWWGWIVKHNPSADEAAARTEFGNMKSMINVSAPLSWDLRPSSPLPILPQPSQTLSPEYVWISRNYLPPSRAHCGQAGHRKQKHPGRAPSVSASPSSWAHNFVCAFALCVGQGNRGPGLHFRCGPTLRVGVLPARLASPDMALVACVACVACAVRVACPRRPVLLLGDCLLTRVPLPVLCEGEFMTAHYKSLGPHEKFNGPAVRTPPLLLSDTLTTHTHTHTQQHTHIHTHNTHTHTHTYTHIHTQHMCLLLPLFCLYLHSLLLVPLCPLSLSLPAPRLVVNTQKNLQRPERPPSTNPCLAPRASRPVAPTGRGTDANLPAPCNS